MKKYIILLYNLREDGTVSSVAYPWTGFGVNTTIFGIDTATFDSKEEAIEAFNLANCEVNTNKEMLEKFEDFVDFANNNKYVTSDMKDSILDLQDYLYNLKTLTDCDKMISADELFVKCCEAEFNDEGEFVSIDCGTLHNGIERVEYMKHQEDDE